MIRAEIDRKMEGRVFHPKIKVSSDLSLRRQRGRRRATELICALVSILTQAATSAKFDAVNVSIEVHEAAAPLLAT
jgi:hypothetical protein